MALYAYYCKPGTHEVEERFPMGKAPATWFCPLHNHWCQRAIGNELTAASHVAMHSNDEFRKAWLSDKPQGNSFEQSPRDKFEAKEMGKRLGRIYVGNDPLKHGMRITPEIQKDIYG